MTASEEQVADAFRDAGSEGRRLVAMLTGKVVTVIEAAAEGDSARRAAIAVLLAQDLTEYAEMEGRRE